jgi:hypothetical protein
MTNALGQVATAYCLPESLSESGSSDSGQISFLDDAEKQDLVLKKLGPRAWGRFHHFRYFYGPGWGEGGGKPLSPRAADLFCRFVEYLTFAGSKKPSLFLTDAGNLEICWEDKKGKAVQIEFTAKGVEYFVESGEIEGKVENGDVASLATYLSSI